MLRQWCCCHYVSVIVRKLRQNHDRTVREKEREGCFFTYFVRKKRERESQRRVWFDKSRRIIMMTIMMVMRERECPIWFLLPMVEAAMREWHMIFKSQSLIWLFYHCCLYFLCNKLLLLAFESRCKFSLSLVHSFISLQRQQKFLYVARV